MFETIKLSKIFEYHPYGTQQENDVPLPLLTEGQCITIPALDDEAVFQVIEQRGAGIIIPAIDRAVLLQLVLDQLACFYDTGAINDHTLSIGKKLPEEERNERWKSFFC